MFATAPATETPQPGDTLRVEVEGYTLRGYLNGVLVLEAEDTDPTKIAEERSASPPGGQSGTCPRAWTPKFGSRGPGGSL